MALVSHEVGAQQGSGRVISELVRHASNRVDFVVVARELDDEVKPLVTWLRVPAPATPYKRKSAVFFLTGALQLLRAHADLIHVHASGPTVPNRADVTTVHLSRAAWFDAMGIFGPGGSRGFRQLSPRTHVAVERWCHRRSRVLLAVSKSEEAVLRRHYPGPPVVVVPNGVDGERFAPDPAVRAEMRAAEAVEQDDVVVLFVGNSWNRKGLAETIDGFALARRADGGPDRLWIAGYGDERRYRAHAVRAGVGDRIRFFGLRTDVERLLRGADVFAQPSSYETFCLAAYEAAACGVPIVATSVGGVAELVGDGEAGVLVRRDDADVARALGLLSADAELRRRMGAAALRRAGGYTWKGMAEGVLAVYERLLGTAL